MSTYHRSLSGLLTQDDCLKFHDVLIFNRWIVSHCVDVPHYIYPFFSWKTSMWFPLSTIMNEASMNIVEQVSLWYERGIFGLYSQEQYTWILGRTIPRFLRKCQIGSQSDCTILHSLQQRREVFPFLHILTKCAETWNFDLSLSDEWKIESQSHFDFCFPNDSVSLIHLDLNCMQGNRYGFISIFLLSDIQLD